MTYTYMEDKAQTSKRAIWDATRFNGGDTDMITRRWCPAGYGKVVYNGVRGQHYDLHIHTYIILYMCMHMYMYMYMYMYRAYWMPQGLMQEDIGHQ